MDKLHSEPLLPWELLEHELPQYLSFHSCLMLGLTCHRMQANWKSWVQEIPSTIVKQCDNSQLISFTELTSLDISETTKITAHSLMTLTNLTSLRLGSTLHISSDQLASFTALTDLRYFNFNRELEQNPQFNPTKEQVLAYMFNTNLSCEVLLLETGLSSGAITTASQFLAAVDLTEVLMTLPRLTSLNLGYNKTNLNELLIRLTSLTSLNLEDNEFVSDDVLRSLTNLTSLQLGYNLKVTDQGLASLPKLKYIDLGVLPERFSQVDELQSRDIEIH